MAQPDVPQPGRLAVSVVAGALVGVLLAACGSPPDDPGVDGETAAVVPTADVASAPAGLTGDAPEASRETGSRSTPTSEWSDRRALEAADAAFPHSAHRELDCRRCHRRPATHVTHVEAACTSCHARPVGFAALPPPSRSECAGCHHRNATARDCTACHDRAALAPRPALAAVATAGGERVRVRRLTFAHQRHAALACTTCHVERLDRAFADDCSLCHTAHHRPEATCISCHDARSVGEHQNVVHAGCAGSGCHDAGTVADLAATRNVCLACHLDQLDHEPGQECRSCHVGLLEEPGRSAAPGARGAPSPGSPGSPGSGGSGGSP